MNKYAALRVISALYLYGGMAVFILGTIIGIASIAGGGNSAFASAAITSTFITALVGLSMMAFGQLIELLMAMEENTRATAESLNRLLRNQGNRQKNNEDEEVPMMPIRKR